MEQSADTQNRLTALEIKASFAEDQIDQLDKVIVRQQLQIDLLIREITQLRQQAPDAAPLGARNLRDELPPHF
jgi:SlyX protein